MHACMVGLVLRKKKTSSFVGISMEQGDRKSAAWAHAQTMLTPNVA